MNVFAEAFADIALGFSQAGLGAYYDGIAKWPGEPEVDDGGSIVAPAVPIRKTCSVQVDGVTERMRQAQGYTDKDVRLLILCATLDGDIDTDAKVEVLAGPHAGEWMIASVDRDPCGVYYECRGRRS